MSAISLFKFKLSFGFPRKFTNLDRHTHSCYNLRMKIYRVLKKGEYDCLCKKGYISKPGEHFGSWYRPERFFNPARAQDAAAKFFFFYLQDAVNYDGRDKNPIIELEISEKEAFKYLTFGDYPDKTGWYQLLELCLPSRIADKKIKEKNFRIMEFSERKNMSSKKLPNSSREPNYLILLNVMMKIACEREAIHNHLCSLQQIDKSKAFERNVSKISEARSLLKQDLEKLPEIFHKFAKEHEKYMMLALSSREFQ